VERAAALAAKQQTMAVAMRALKSGIPPPRPSETQQRLLLETLHLRERPFRSPSAASAVTAGSSVNSPSSPIVAGSPRPRGGGGGVVVPRGGLPPPSPQDGSSKRLSDGGASKKGFTIQSGFDTLRSLIPSLNTGDPQTDSCKISKAALLTKGGDYLKELKAAKAENTREIKARKEAIAKLQSELKSLQSELPFGGKEKRKRKGNNSNREGEDDESNLRDIQTLFIEHARECSIKTNWKYWVFADLMKPLAESFERILGNVDFDHTATNASVWLDQCCGLPQLRALMTEQLRNISVNTNILYESDNFPHETLIRAANVVVNATNLVRNRTTDFEDNYAIKDEVKDHDG